MSPRKFVLVTVALAVALAGVADPAAAGRRNRALAKKAKAAPAASTFSMAGIAAHPRLLEYPELDYPAPNRAGHRHELANGVVVYVVEDHDLPLVSVSFTVRGGDYLEPDGKQGLSDMTASLMRTGGAGSMDAATFDEEIAFLAANIGTGGGVTESSASLNVLKKDLGAGLDLLFAAMKEPRFQEDRVELLRKQILQGLERRNDRTPGIEGREWNRLIYGEDYVELRPSTEASIKSINVDDLKAWHRRIWHPANFLVAVSGDVTPAEILPELEKRMAGWWTGETSPHRTSPTHVPEPGVFVVNKDDVNQSRVRIGHLSSRWDDPDWPKLTVMNDILGGGGFTSRITRRVRSDEGLAYSAGSGWAFGRDYPRFFFAFVQSRNEAVPRAIALMLEEMKELQTEAVDEETLATSKNSFIETFPAQFSSASAKASLFVNGEITGRPADWWEKYRPAIQAVSAEDVRDVAARRLRPDDMTILVVGKIDEVVAGDKDHPEYQLEKLAGEHGILEIALPDPKSMVYPHPPRPYRAEAAAGSGL